MKFEALLRNRLALCVLALFTALHVHAVCPEVTWNSLPNGFLGSDYNQVVTTNSPWTEIGGLHDSDGNDLDDIFSATLLTNGNVLAMSDSVFPAMIYDPVTQTSVLSGYFGRDGGVYTTTLLTNGMVLIVGTESRESSNEVAQLYDPATGVGVAAGSMNAPRNAHTATRLANGKVLIVGGNDIMTDGYPFLSSAEVYDPATGTWATTGSMITPRNSHSATLLPNGKVLVVGGDGDVNNPWMSAELYDPATGTWQTTTPTSHAHTRHTATLLPNGKVLVAGGYSPSASAELYNPVTGTWTDAGNMNTARGLHSATLLQNGKVLVAGGWNNGNLTSAEIYNPTTGTWTAIRGMHTARSGHNAILLPNGTVLITGGGGELYSPPNNSFYGYYSVTSGSLPSGLSLTSYGVLTGKPSAAGESTFTVTVTNLNRCTFNKSYTITVSCPNITIDPDPTSLACQKGVLYHFTYIASGGAAPYSYAVTSGSLPSGLTFSTNGALNGIPSILGESTFSVSVTDAYGCTVTKTSSISVTDCPNITLSPLPNGALSNNYNQRIFSRTSTDTAQMVSPRLGHIATLLANGKVLVIGGNPPELYDPATGLWTATAPPPPLFQPGIVTLLPSGKVLITGWYTSVLYDPDADTWAPTANDLQGQVTTTTVLQNGKVLILKSIWSECPQNPNWGFPEDYVDIFDPATETWTPTGQLTIGRGGATATLLADGKVLVAGGYSGLNGCGIPSAFTLASAEIYDPVTGIWTTTGALNTARGSHTATLLPNGKVLIAGGGDHGLALYGGQAGRSFDSAELYDPATGLWTVTGSLLTERAGGTATLLPSGKVLLSGGIKYGGYQVSVSTAELYDPGTGVWAEMAPLSMRLQKYTTTLLPNGKVLVAGGIATNLAGWTHLTADSVPSVAELYDVTSAAVGPLTFSVASGSLPDGLSLSSDGLLSGTPTALATNTFSATMTDANGCTAIRNYVMTVGFPNILVNHTSGWATLPSLDLGLFYSFTNTAKGGTPPYTFEIDRWIPEGLSLSPDGVLSGIIATNYNWPGGAPSPYLKFILVATDANGHVGQGQLSEIPINPLDTNAPTVSITSPVADVTVTTAGNSPAADLRTQMDVRRTVTNASFRISGIAKSKTGIETVHCSVNGREQFTGTINNFKDWTAVVSLERGTNIITAQGVDRRSRISTLKTKTIVYIEPTPLTLAINGSGDIVSTPAKFGIPVNGAALGIGLSYTITAMPRANYLFLNWTGTINSSVAKLNFTMERGMALTANFVPNPFIKAAGKYNGLFHEVAGVTHQTAGFFSITLRSSAAFSGKLIMDGDTVLISGKFNADGTVTKTISRTKQGKSDLTLVLTLSGPDKIDGSVSGTDWTSDLEANRAIFSDFNPATAYANYYTMLLPGFADSAAGPPGYSFGRVTISQTGGVKFNGATADGITMSQSTPISSSGTFPFYVPLYKSTKIYPNGTINRSYYLGSMLGWLAFTNNAPTGTVSWIKTVGSSPSYANGFTNESAWFGSLYVAPAPGASAVDFVTGTITLTNGNLSSAITRNLSVNTNILIITPTNNSVKLVLAASKGTLAGTFKHPDNGNLATPIKGVVLQDQKIGGGFFTGPNQGGLLLLEGD